MKRADGNTNVEGASRLEDVHSSETRTERRDPASRERLRRRVVNEFREMPGLLLTLPQACRLFDLPEAACTRVFSELMTAREVAAANNHYRLAK